MKDFIKERLFSRFTNIFIFFPILMVIGLTFSFFANPIEWSGNDYVVLILTNVALIGIFFLLIHNEYKLYIKAKQQDKLDQYVKSRANQGNN